MAGATTLNVIESFLEVLLCLPPKSTTSFVVSRSRHNSYFFVFHPQVTEIGAVSKMLKRKGSKMNTVREYVNIEGGDGMAKGDEKHVDNEREKGRKRRKELSYIDWINGIIFAPTFNEGWRIFREGRYPEVCDV